MTLHPDELTDGYRRRIRKSGKCPDKSKVIEKIAHQQEKRARKSRPKSTAGFQTDPCRLLLSVVSDGQSENQ